MSLRSANPALNDKTFVECGRMMSQDRRGGMTIDGTVNKTAILLGCVMLTSFYSWSRFLNGDLRSVYGLMMVGIFGGLISALITIFKKNWSPLSAPIYALFEGLMLGGFSAYMESMLPGIVLQAVGLTFGTLFGLLLAYKSGMIRATENFKLGISAAIGGIFIVYLVTMVLGFFGVNVPYIHGNGIIGIAFSLGVVVIAALSLVLDFDFIEKGCETNAPKFMEWYGAFGLMVTLIWLYMEILRLISKLNSRR